LSSKYNARAYPYSKLEFGPEKYALSLALPTELKVMDAKILMIAMTTNSF
jgi:hypothetical protein